MTSDTLREWIQTVVQIIAFGGAVFVAIWQQRRVDRRVADDRRRRHVACRATLPLSLASVSQYTENCVNLLRPTYPLGEDFVMWAEAPKFPQIPDNVIDSLKEAIESGEGSATESLASLVRFCQVQRSRMVGKFSQSAGDIWLDQHAYNQIFLDIVKLYSLSEQFYEYGRMEKNVIETKLESADLERATRVLGLGNLKGFAKYIGMRDLDPNDL